MKRRILALSLASAMVVGALASCSTTAEPVSSQAVEARDVSLVLWGAEQDQDFLKAQAAEFATKYTSEHEDVKSITVDVKIVGEGDSATEALKDINAAADVFGVPGDQTGALADAKAIYAMPDDVANQIKALVGESTAAKTFYNGSYYGFPYAPNTAQALYYNTDIFTEDDVKSLNTMLEKEGVTAKVLGNETGAFHSTTWYFTGGGELFTGSDKSICTFDTDECAAVLEFMQNNNDKLWVGSSDDAVNLIKDGGLAAWLAGSWDSQKMKDAFGDKMGVTALPTVTVDGKDYQMKCFGGVKYYAVNAASKEPEVAIALAEYLSSADVQLKKYEASGAIPTALALLDNATIKADPVAVAYMQQGENIVVQEPVIPGDWWGDAEALYKSIFNKEVVGRDAIKAEVAKHVESWKAM